MRWICGRTDTIKMPRHHRTAAHADNRCLELPCYAQHAFTVKLFHYDDVILLPCIQNILNVCRVEGVLARFYSQIVQNKELNEVYVRWTILEPLFEKHKKNKKTMNCLRSHSQLD